MTALTRTVRRVVSHRRRDLVVTLYPGTVGVYDTSHGIGGEGAEIEVRELGRRVGYRVSVATLYTMLAARAAGLPAPKGRRARRIK